MDVETARPDQILARIMAPRRDAVRLLVRRSGGGRQEIRMRRPRPVPALPVRPVPDSTGRGMGNRPSIPGPHSTGRPEVLRRAGVVIGDPYVDFTLPRRGGGTLTLSEFAGRPIFVDFWATWCAPCRAEAPALARI